MVICEKTLQRITDYLSMMKYLRNNKTEKIVNACEFKIISYKKIIDNFAKLYIDIEDSEAGKNSKYIFKFIDTNLAEDVKTEFERLLRDISNKYN